MRGPDSRSSSEPAAFHTKNPVAEAVGLPDAPVLTTRAARGTGLAFLELNLERRNVGITPPVREDAFLVALQLKTCPDFDLYADGKSIPPEDFDAGAVAILDLRMNLATELRDPFHAVNFYMPHKALLALGDDGDIPRHIQELRHTPGATTRDPIARDLLLAMRPALAQDRRKRPNSSSITLRWRSRYTSQADTVMPRHRRECGQAALPPGKNVEPKTFSMPTLAGASP